MFTRPLIVVATSLFAVSCGGAPADDEAVTSTPEASPPPIGALRGIPLMPESRVTGLSGSGEAAEATTYTVVTPDSAASWYRRALLARGWDLVGDARLPDGSRTLHAKAPSGRPVWVIVRRAEQGEGSVVSVIGTPLDTTAN